MQGTSPALQPNLLLGARPALTSGEAGDGFVWMWEFSKMESSHPTGAHSRDTTLLATGIFLRSHKGRFRLAIRKNFFNEKHWNRLLSAVVEPAFQEVLRKCLDIALRDVL